MSKNYSAHQLPGFLQYREPFLPTRLGNWMWDTNRSKNPTTHCGATSIIASDRGHILLSNMKNPNSSPWGSGKSWIWEERCKCSCVTILRSPQLYDRPPCNIVIANEKRYPVKIAAETGNKMVSEILKEKPKPVQILNIEHKTENKCKDIQL